VGFLRACLTHIFCSNLTLPSEAGDKVVFKMDQGLWDLLP